MSAQVWEFVLYVHAAYSILSGVCAPVHTYLQSFLHSVQAHIQRVKHMYQPTQLHLRCCILPSDCLGSRFWTLIVYNTLLRIWVYVFQCLQVDVSYRTFVWAKASLWGGLTNRNRWEYLSLLLNVSKPAAYLTDPLNSIQWYLFFKILTAFAAACDTTDRCCTLCIFI